MMPRVVAFAANAVTALVLGDWDILGLAERLSKPENALAAVAGVTVTAVAVACCVSVADAAGTGATVRDAETGLETVASAALAGVTTVGLPSANCDPSTSASAAGMGETVTAPAVTGFSVVAAAAGVGLVVTSASDWSST
jgi:hypothetical protein